MTGHATPRPRAELDEVIAGIKERYGAGTARYNELVATIKEAEAELATLGPRLAGIEHETHDLDWEYFRRLQLDGVVPTIPRRVFFDESRLDEIDLDDEVPDSEPYAQGHPGVDEHPARG